MTIHADVSVLEDVEAMIARVDERWGRLDVLYNNAAVQMSGRLLECTTEQWDLTIATNLDAVFWACRAAIPLLQRDGTGSIINTASVLGLIGSEGYCAYGAAKAGLVALTARSPWSTARDPGKRHRPRVHQHAGFQRVADDMDDPEGFVAGLERTIPLRRLGTAEDVAGIATFLATDASAYMSGAILPADGGLAALR